MCGVLYKHNFDGSPVNDAIFDQYYAQRARGTEGFGIYDGQELNMVHETQEHKIVKWLSKYDSNMILMHHRWPTSTVNVKRAAHPFSTKKYFGNTEYILVHNGVMRNHFDLFEEHQELGIEYHSLLDDLTFNDSEALLWDFALTMEGKQPEMKSIGRIAFICLKKTDGVLTHMYFGRNSNPLNLTRTKDSIELSSEGKGDPIQSNTLYTWNYALKRLTTKEFELTEYEPFVANSYSSQYQYTPPQALPYRSSWEDEMDVEEEEGEYRRNWTGQAGAWLGDTLRRKYGNLLDQMEYEDEVELEVECSDNEIQTEAMSYLAKYQGHFEEAYWALEMDYEDVMNEEDTYDNIQRRVLLEGTLDYISRDPEYENENSVSSMWSALWA